MKTDPQQIEFEKSLQYLSDYAHGFYVSYEAAMKAFGEQEMEHTKEALKLSQTLIQAVGVVAGFGFTALQSVIHHKAFVLGEAFLLGGIIFGFYSLSRYYDRVVESLQKGRDELRVLFENKSEVIMDMQKALLESAPDGISPEKGIELQKRLNEADNALIVHLRKPNKPEKERAIDLFKYLMISLGIGGVLLLLSFLRLGLTVHLYGHIIAF